MIKPVERKCGRRAHEKPLPITLTPFDLFPTACIRLSSPVFRELLHDESSGSFKATLPLPGKSKEEFELFLQALLPASMRFSTLADEPTYLTLVRWAHEFEVANLRELCEDHLIKSVAVDEASIVHALEYGLTRRLAQCISVMKADLPRYAEVLGHLTDDSATRPQLEELWPLLCEAADVRVYEMPPQEHLRAMWPFLSSAIRKAHRPVVTEVAEELQHQAGKVAADLKKAVFDTTSALPEVLSEGAASLNQTTKTYAAWGYERFWKDAKYLQEALYSWTPLSGPSLTSKQPANE